MAGIKRNIHNQLSVGLRDAYSGYCYIRVSTNIEQTEDIIYPGKPWILRVAGGKVGIALISSSPNLNCKLKVYKVDELQKK